MWYNFWYSNFRGLPFITEEIVDLLSISSRPWSSQTVGICNSTGCFSNPKKFRNAGMRPIKRNILGSRSGLTNLQAVWVQIWDQGNYMFWYSLVKFKPFKASPRFCLTRPWNDPQGENRIGSFLRAMVKRSYVVYCNPSHNGNRYIYIYI